MTSQFSKASSNQTCIQRAFGERYHAIDLGLILRMPNLRLIKLKPWKKQTQAIEGNEILEWEAVLPWEH